MAYAEVALLSVRLACAARLVADIVRRSIPKGAHIFLTERIELFYKFV